MKIKEHNKVTGFSGNEIYCLHKLGYGAGQLCLGNNVIALGAIKGFTAGISNLVGGEVVEVTKLVHDGRKSAYNRMMEEANHYGGIGLANVSFEMVNHLSNLEFIAIGSTVKNTSDDKNISFSTADDAQGLYCQIDSGFKPHSLVFGNIAYSIGVGGSIKGALRGLKRGEVDEYTEIFDHTRHLALTRIKEEAKAVKANAVIGIKTSIIPLMGTQEMMMLGTAASHPALSDYFNDPVTCDLTNEELWNMVSMGYLPVSLVMGVSVYSVGVVSGIGAMFKNFIGGHVDSLTELLYEAREKALERIQRDAEKCNADEVVGVKTYIFDLGGGLVEFMAIGTAVKKIDGITTHTPNLMPQAIIQDRDTFVDKTQEKRVAINQSRSSSARRTQAGPLTFAFGILCVIGYIAAVILGLVQVK